MAPKILTGIGCALFGLCAVALVICLALPIVNAPRTSWEEMMVGIIPSAVCTCLSVFPMGGGIGWMLMSRKKQAP